MSALRILDEVKAAGGCIKLAAPDRLRVEAPTPLSPMLVEQVKAYKPEIIRYLSEPSAVPDIDTFAERAALIEANGVPKAWAEGFARLDLVQPTDNVPARRWRLFIDDCGRFLDGGWARQAAALGWGPLNLFGCDRDSPLVRLDHAGLLWLIEGRKLVELSRVQANIECADGKQLTFYRRPAAVGQVVLAWDLAD